VNHESNRNLVRLLIRLAIGLTALVVILIMLTAALVYQVVQRQETIEDVQVEVHDIQSYVDELRQPPTEDEIAQDAAIGRAVSLVPEVKDILCDETAFPEAEGCQE
jgi:hypothetical protein